MALHEMAAPAMAQVPGLELRPMPYLVVGAELLALDAAALEERLLREAADNPALAVRRRCGRCGRVSVAAVCQACRQPRPTEGEPLAAASSAREGLLADALASAPRSLAPVIEAVVASLDRHGLLLETTSGELMALTGCTAAVLDAALAAVRRVGPAGIASFNARGCLLAKIDEAEVASEQGAGVAGGRVPAGGTSTASWALARRVVEHGLEAVAEGNFAPVASSLGCESDDVAGAVELVRRRLTPYPEIDLGDDGPPAAVPDILFTVRNGGLVVEVVDPLDGAVGLSEEFVAFTARAADRSARAFVGAQVVRARLLLAGLERRRSTIERVAAAVAEHHRDALLSGAPALAPLHRRDVAADLGVHESTVSRAVRHRVVRFPDGRVRSLASLFGSGRDVRATLAELIAEQPGHSDQQLAGLLADRGMIVARRTVAKYRAEMGLACSTRRASRPAGANGSGS